MVIDSSKEAGDGSEFDGGAFDTLDKALGYVCNGIKDVDEDLFSGPILDEEAEVEFLRDFCRKLCNSHTNIYHYRTFHLYKID